MYQESASESEEGSEYNKYIHDLLQAVQDQSTDSVENLRKLLATPPADEAQEIAALFGAMLQIAIISPHSATTDNVVEKIRMLLEAGADIHIAYHPLIKGRNSFNKLPIHNVCSLTHLNRNGIRKKILQLLLDHGADSNSHDDFKNTPLHYICHMGDFVCIDENGNESVDFDCIKLLIDHGADCNAANHMQNVPLVACVSGIRSENSVSYNQNLYDIAKYLLENGADPDANLRRFKRACNPSEVEEDLASEVDADVDVDAAEVDLSKLECGDKYVELVVSAIIQYMEDANIEPDQIEKMRQYIDYTFGFDSTLAELPFEEFIKYPNLRKMTILALERWEAKNYEGMSVTMMDDVRNILAQAKYLETQTI